MSREACFMNGMNSNSFEVFKRDNSNVVHNFLYQYLLVTQFSIQGNFIQVQFNSIVFVLNLGYYNYCIVYKSLFIDYYETCFTNNAPVYHHIFTPSFFRSRVLPEIMS